MDHSLNKYFTSLKEKDMFTEETTNVMGNSVQHT